MAYAKSNNLILNDMQNQTIQMIKVQNIPETQKTFLNQLKIFSNNLTLNRTTSYLKV